MRPMMMIMMMILIMIVLYVGLAVFYFGIEHGHEITLDHGPVNLRGRVGIRVRANYAQSCWVDYQALRSPAGLY